MSRALGVLQMKQENVLKSLVAGTHLGGSNLDFQMKQYIYKREGDVIYIIHLKRSFCWQLMTLLIENSGDVSVLLSRNTD